MEMTVKTLLLQEFAERQTRNSAYSLRAFARDLGVGSTTVSDVLAGKRVLSKKNQHKVLDKLFVSPLLKEKIMKETFRMKVSKTRDRADERLTLDEDTFHLIADWHYIAILNLAKLKNNQSSPTWIARRLGLEKNLVVEALERLFRLQLIKKNRGRLIRTSKPLTTSSDIPSSAIKKHHLQILRLAEQSLLHDPVHLREISLVTMPINIEKLAKAKEVLLKTRKKLASLLEDDSATEVYTLAFQLFPMTKGNSDV